MALRTGIGKQVSPTIAMAGCSLLLAIAGALGLGHEWRRDLDRRAADRDRLAALAATEFAPQAPNPAAHPAAPVGPAVAAAPGRYRIVVLIVPVHPHPGHAPKSDARSDSRFDI